MSKHVNYTCDACQEPIESQFERRTVVMSDPNGIRKDESYDVHEVCGRRAMDGIRFHLDRKARGVA